MTVIDELVISFDERIRELEIELEATRAARATLAKGSSGAKHPRRPERPHPSPTESADASRQAGGTRPGRGQRRGRGAVGADELFALLVNEGDLDERTLARRLGADLGRVVMLLKDVERSGRVSRAWGRWHALSEEEQIAKRAAELERRSSTSRDTGTSDGAAPAEQVSSSAEAGTSAEEDGTGQIRVTNPVTAARLNGGSG